jgi:alcohol dehydrogenase class IV
MRVDSARSFRWQDGERLIVFGRGAAVDAVATAGGPGYTLLSTERCEGLVPGIVEQAAAVHRVGLGRVDELAGELKPVVEGGRLVALGGGRVVDVAKALAAAAQADGRDDVTVAAIPTTLSGAEMTSVHRHAAGVPLGTPRVRPAIVINDPALSASQPAAEQAASAANALGHIAEGPLTPFRNPVAAGAALAGARLLAAAFASTTSDSDEREDELALAALLAGYVIGSTWYGLHHVISQTLARNTPAGHGGSNAIMLPHTLGALSRRFPAELEDLGEALGAEPSAFAAGLAALTGRPRLRDVGVTPDQLDRCADDAATRPELQMTPPAADRAELRALLGAAY